MIRRRRGRHSKPETETTEHGVDGSDHDDFAGDDAFDADVDEDAYDDDLDGVDQRAEAEGPFDAADVEDTSQLIDLGGLLLPSREGMELRIDYDEASGAVGAVTVVIGPSALQLQPFAAPRTTGIWDEIRPEIAAGITQQGGVASEQDGPFGVELRAQIPGLMPDGKPGTQPVRFIGVDGPRWFLRGVLTGAAYDDPAAAAPLEDVFRNAVVVRGGEPMPPREPILLQLPRDVSAGADADADADAENDEPEGEQRPPLAPFERGPEITEVR